MTTGLMLEGGAMRGLFTAGVLDFFLEHDLSFDKVVGVSAGAAFGGNLKSRQKGRVLRYNTRFCRDARYCSLRNLIRTGDLYGADFCYRLLPDELDPFDYETYRSDPTDFYCVCTDADTGEALYKQINRLTKEEFLYLQASASMPIVSRAVEANSKRLLDGGIADSLPLDFLTSLGCNKRVVILTRPKGYRKKPLKGAFFIKCALRKLPAVSNRLLSRHEHYNRALCEIEAMEHAGELFVIRPSTALHARVIERNENRLRSFWQSGYDAAKAAFEDLKRYLEAE